MLVNGLSGHTPDEIIAVDPGEQCVVALHCREGVREGGDDDSIYSSVPSVACDVRSYTRIYLITSPLSPHHLFLEFVKYAGVTKSLTPGRNNGFVNMLHLMKLKAGQFKQQSSSSSSLDDDDDVVGATAASSSSVVVVAADEEKRVRSEGMMMMEAATAASNIGGGPVFQSMHRKLSLLQPVSMAIEDESYKHAGHTGR